MTQPRPLLNYGVDDLRRRRRRALRIVVLVGIPIAAIAVVAIGWGQPIAAQIRIMILQHAAQGYAVPSGTVVYEEDPVRAAKLIRESAYVPVGHFVAEEEDHAWGAKPLQTDPMEFFARVDPAVRKRVSQGTDYAPILYCGLRQTAGGSARILIVIGVLDNNGLLTCVAATIQEAELFGTPKLRRLVEWPSTSSPTARFYPLRDARIFAGQADADNAARFSIGYEFEGSKHHVVGQLQSDETVAFSETVP
jgi:hypothetical protein